MKKHLGLLVFCLCFAGSANAERALNTSGFLSSGPVLVTANIPGPHVVCVTRVIVEPNEANTLTNVAIALLNASNGRILKVREAALKVPGEEGAGVCLSATTAELLAGSQNVGQLNIIAVAVEDGIVVQGVVQGGINQGGIPGGGCIVASFQLATIDNSGRYISMGHP